MVDGAALAFDTNIATNGWGACSTARINATSNPYSIGVAIRFTYQGTRSTSSFRRRPSGDRVRGLPAARDE